MVSEVSGMCFASVWKVSGRSLKVSARYLEVCCMLFGRCLQGVCKVSRRCMKDVWKVVGKCLEGVWKVSGRCLECVLKASVKLGQVKSGQE